VEIAASHVALVAGATEVMIGTMGSDIPRELRAFARLLGR
jgi:hypothetical protein